MPASQKLKLPHEPVARRITQLVNELHKGNILAASQKLKDVSYNQLWKVCHGHYTGDVPLSMVKSVARGFGVGLDWLVYGPE